MKKLRKLKKGLAILLSLAMVLGYLPGMGNMQVSAAETGYSDPSTDGSGIYQLSTAEDLYWFAQYVNAGNTTVDAVLTQDISAGSMTEEWTPIGTYNNPYAGNFDGQGHTIRGLTVTGTADYVGLFGKIYHARIWNVGIADSSFQGNKYVGGICGQAYNGNSGYTEIGNCYSTATVSGSSYVGGFCGMNQYAAIFNSFSAATVTGEDSFTGMFCGASLNLLELNCYYLSENENGASGYCRTQEEFASGKVAYNLAKGFQYFSNFKSGDIWGQSIGSDGLPVFNGAKVEYSQRQYHNHIGEYCEICAGEPKSDNGVYQLYTADDLYWFAGLVNGTTSGLAQNAAADAVLCADITINQDVNVADTSGLRKWTSIGTQTTPYTGNFDGQSHTISGLYVVGEVYGGLFGKTGADAKISKVGVVNSKISATTAAGGICGENGGTIQDCYNTGTVSSSGTAGGICGINSKTVKACYNTGTVSGSTASGGIYGSTSGEGISNCYYLAAAETNPSDGTAGKTQEQFTSGEVCYLLNGSQGEGNLTWGQTMDVDPAPVFGGKAVFCGNGIYHNHMGNECTTCAGGPEQINGIYQIKTADDLYWFAGLVNGTLPYKKQNTWAYAVLTADITVNETVFDENGRLVDKSVLREWTPVGNSVCSYNGTFDGQGHTIRGLYLDTSDNFVGLFGNAADASVSNVTVADSYFSGKKYVGGVIGIAVDSTVTDCSFTGSVSGTDYYVGGVIGYIYDGTVTGCYNTGSVSGTKYVGGVMGVVHGGTVTDCYNVGSVSGTGFAVGGVIGEVTYGAVAKNSYNVGNVSGTGFVGAVVGVVSGTVQNCYYLSDSETDSIAGTSCQTSAQFASGEVTGLLNGNRTTIVWGQKLGENGDAYPVLNGPQVYATYPCLSFSNTPFESENKEHDFKNGVCTGCRIPDRPMQIDGVYQISNEAQLYWFAGLVNGTLSDMAKDTSAKAVLTDHITVNRGVLKEDGSLAATSGLKAWTPIGTSDNQYRGSFDGKGYTISGLYLGTTNDDVGLFGCTNAASIFNVTVADSYFSGNGYVGGVIGYISYGTVTNCYNAGSVSGTRTSNYVGGVIGKTSKATVKGCYNTGSVSGTFSVGGVIGETIESTVTNCHNAGSVSGTEYVGGVIGKIGKIDNRGTVTGCYNTGSVSGSESIGGVIGKATYVTVTDCYNTGSISGKSSVGGVTGYVNNASFTNCCYLADSETDFIDGTSYKTATQFASGEVAYLLNGSTSQSTEETPLVWYQNLGEYGDTSPVLDNTHGVVYQCTGCTGTYSNTKNQAAEHIDDGLDGKCDACGIDFKTFEQLGKLITKVNQNLSDGKYADVQYTTASIDNLRKALVVANAITETSSEAAITEAFDNLLAASTVGAGGLIKADKNIVIAFADTGAVRGIAAGNGWYAIGDNVTLKVTPSVGYTFSKWTTDTEGNTLVGTESTYTITLVADSPSPYHAWLDEVKYTVTCESAEGGICSTDAEDGKYVYGQTAKVTATPSENYTFVGWKDSYGTTVSMDTVYSFTVLGNTTLTPKFVKTKTDEGTNITYVTVSFYHQSGKLLDSQKVVSDEGKITTTVNAPTKVGFDFLGWSAKASGATVKDVIDFSTATFSEDTSLYPVFAAQDITYTLTVDSRIEKKAPQSSVTVTADPIEGKKFVGWKNADGNIVSYDSTYTFIITGDTTLTSYYEPNNAVIEKTPTISMSAPVYEVSGNIYKMIFYFDYTIPEDCTLIDIGTIRLANQDKSTEGITFETEGVLQCSVLSKLGVDGQFYYSKSNYIGNGHTVAGYMIYEKNGIRYTVYSNAMYGIKASE